MHAIPTIVFMNQDQRRAAAEQAPAYAPIVEREGVLGYLMPETCEFVPLKLDQKASD